MSDIALVYNSESGTADLDVVDNDIATDDSGLEEAVFISLFTDRRAEDTDALPSSDPDQRGWWGDAVAPLDGDLTGSRLWLLSRSVETADLPDRVRQYAAESLQWLIEDKVAARVDATAEIIGNGVLTLSVGIVRPTGQSVSFRYNYNWVAQKAKRA